MFIFFLSVLLLIPGTMIIFGLIWQKWPPKTINCIYGYRTKQSMKSQESWKFAHRYAGTIWLYSGVPLLIVSIVLLVIFRSDIKDELAITALIINGIQLVCIFLPIIPTEIALKERFDEESMP